MNVPTKPMTAGRMRWWIVGLLFVITVINYVDRQSLSLLAPDIQRYLRIDDRVYGHVVTSFLLAYTVAYIFAGRVCDWLGTRRSMALFVGWWSFAEMLPPFARSGLSLGMGRFMLGLGEAGNYVVIPKAVRQWFPAEERALAIGICTSGATIGATLAPLIIATVASSSGARGCSSGRRSSSLTERGRCRFATATGSRACAAHSCPAGFSRCLGREHCWGEPCAPRTTCGVRSRLQC